jgi:predicted cation transporter
MGLIGPEVIPAVILLGLISMFFVQSKESSDTLGSKQPAESYKEIIIRAAKIYLFVMALTFLGHGFEPLITEYVIGLSPELLYWINMISAILDNATLAAAERALGNYVRARALTEKVVDLPGDRLHEDLGIHEPGLVLDEERRARPTIVAEHTEETAVGA